MPDNPLTAPTRLFVQGKPRLNYWSLRSLEASGRQQKLTMFPMGGVFNKRAFKTGNHMYLCTCEKMAEKGDFGSCFRVPFHRTPTRKYVALMPRLMPTSNNHSLLSYVNTTPFNRLLPFSIFEISRILSLALLRC